MPAKIYISQIKVRQLNNKDWPALESLFGSKGACGGCWCMHWRVEKGGKDWERRKGEINRKDFKKLIRKNKVQGIIAFHNDQTVGWCSFGRRSEFPRVLKMKAYQRDSKNEVWSINCFYLHKDYRGISLGHMLAEAAVDAIKKQSSGEIEGYPVTLTKDGKKLPAAFSFTGSEAIFKKLGFKECQRIAPSQPMYLIKL